MKEEAAQAQTAEESFDAKTAPKKEEEPAAQTATPCKLFFFFSVEKMEDHELLLLSSQFQIFGVKKA